MSADVSPHPFGPVPERPTFCAECFGDQPDAIHHVDDVPAGAEPDDNPEALAAELIAEYAAAIERRRDRAEEACAGARYMRRHRVPVGPRDLAELVRCDRRDAQHRLATTQADELSPAGPIRWTPIGASGLGAPRLLVLLADGSCETCGRPESGHDRRHDLPGSPVLCLA